MLLTIAYPLAYTVAGVWLLTGVGNWLCGQLFSLNGMKDTVANSSDGFRAGWIIGWLERLILSAGIITQSWEILAAVVALKTVARFKELDQKPFAEYFLIGSLFSILWAMLATAGWLAFDHSVGVDLRQKIETMIQAEPVKKDKTKTG